MADRIESWDLFLKVAEFGSFSEAARRAGVSPGQVSKTISSLEGQIGSRLFERTTRAVRLTAEGQAHIEPAELLIQAADRLRASAAEDPTLVGTIRVSAPIIYGTRIVAPLIAGFLDDHPDLNIRLSLTDRPVDLVNDGVDIALRIGTLADTSLKGRRLSSINMQLLAAPALWAGRVPPARPSDLANQPCVIDLNMSEPRRWTFLAGSNSETVRVDGRLETDSADVALQATQAGLGIGLIPDFCLCEGATDGLEPVLPGWQAPTRDVWLLWPSARHLALRTRKLVDYLARQVPLKQAEGREACVNTEPRTLSSEFEPPDR
ncbi:MAG: LysR family transcriptional regulator [Pseudomonadota bacterium]